MSYLLNGSSVTPPRTLFNKKEVKMKRPKFPKGTQPTYYSTRNMRSDLLSRMRITAALIDSTIEIILNEAIEIGIKEIEKRIKEMGRLKNVRGK